MAIVHLCGVCGKPCKRRRKTCGDSACVQAAIQNGCRAGAAVGAAKAKASRAEPYIESGVFFVPLTQGAFTKIDAQDADKVDEAARRLHGEFVRVNFPVGDERSAL